MQCAAKGIIYVNHCRGETQHIMIGACIEHRKTQIISAAYYKMHEHVSTISVCAYSNSSFTERQKWRIKKLS